MRLEGARRRPRGDEARIVIASARVIQKNGGVLDSESYSERAGRVTQRYWIDLLAEKEHRCDVS